MATAKRNFSISQDLYKTTNGYSGSDSDITTEQYSSACDMIASGQEGAQLHLKYKTSSGTTDDLEVKVYASEEGTNFDDIPTWSQTFANNGTTETEVSFVIKDLLNFRVGLARSGSTDTYYAHLTYRAWNWDIT
jgi:hypothetical protein